MHLSPEPMNAADLADLVSDYENATAVSASCRTINLLRHILWLRQDSEARESEARQDGQKDGARAYRHSLVMNSAGEMNA